MFKNLMFKKTGQSKIKFFKYFICMATIALYSQPNGKLQAKLPKSEIYLKDVEFEWMPSINNHDIHRIKLSEFRFGFSDLDLAYHKRDSLISSKITFSGPNLSLKGVSLSSKVRSDNWITNEKIRLLQKRELIPRQSIELIAKAIDLHLIDQGSLPKSLNELIIKNYVTMESPPLNDYSWRYELNLPEKIVAKPTQINIVPNDDFLIFDWQSRSFQINPKSDSLYNAPLADWEYFFELKEISQNYTSKMEFEFDPQSLEYDLMMERGKFNISGASFTALPNNYFKEQSKISLPDLTIESNDMIINGLIDSSIVIHRINGRFRIRNFEIKIPEGIINEPEVERILENLGIWNNSLMIRLVEMEINMINQFTGDYVLRFHTPFLKINVKGNMSLRQNGFIPKIRLNNAVIQIHPISLGVKNWINSWEKKNGKNLTRKGGTVIIKLEGPIENPLIWY